MPKYARPRLTLVVDEDVAELAKQLADMEKRPLATFAALVFGEAIKQMAREKGLLGKSHPVASDHKT